VKKFLAFLAVGSFFSSVEEFLTVVVLRHDFGSFLFTLLILFPVFLTLVYFSSRLIRRFIQSARKQEAAHFFVYGLAGLMIEWFLIGLSPWADPTANPLLMLVFQFGMFSFWAAVGFAPRLFANTDELSRETRRNILKFYIPYFIVVYAFAFLAAPSLKFLGVIGLIILGYFVVNLFFIRYFLASRRVTIPE
jgi:hypothetical protein